MCSRRESRACRGTSAPRRAPPEATPQLQKVTPIPCGLVAFESPAIIRRLFGNGSTSAACRAGSRRSQRRGAPRSFPGRARAPSTRPCRRGLHARRSARAQRAVARERVRRAVADERVLVRGAWLARVHDRVVGRLVRVAAVLDEVDADESGPRDPIVVRLSSRERGRAECGRRRADDEAEHDDANPFTFPPSTGFTTNPDTERFGIRDQAVIGP